MRIFVNNLILVFLFSAACGKSVEINSANSLNNGSIGAEPENPDTKGLDHTPFSEPWKPGMDYALGQYQVQCEECHPAVATFISFHGQKPHACGGTLIDENRILTAKHCLEKSIQTAGSDCSQSGYFLFPSIDGFYSESVRCLQVESVSASFPQLSEEDPQPDWAIVRIERPIHGRAAAQNTKGLKDGEKLRFYKPMFDNHKRVIHFKRYQCINFLESDLEPSADNEISALMMIQCDRLFSKGYSGFGIFNQQGELVGNESHMVHPDRKTPRTSRNAVGSNLACILALEKPENRELCKWEPDDKPKRRKKIFVKRFVRVHEEVKDAFAKWLMENPQPIEWEPVDITQQDKMPDEYKEYFAQQKSLESEIFEKVDADQLSVLHLPYYPKCFKEVKTEGFNFPVVHVVISLDDKGMRPKIDFAIETLPAGMAKGAKGWYLGHTQKSQLQPDLASKGKKVIYKGFVSKKVDIKLCK